MLSFPYPRLRGRARSGRSVGLVKHIPSRYFHQPRIDLPNRTIDIHSRALERHAPGFHHLWRESGNTRIEPMSIIRPHLTNYNQEDMYEKAVNWLFFRVTENWYPSYRGPISRYPMEDNPLEATMDDIDYYIFSRNYNQAETLINDVFEVFRGLSHLVKPGNFGGLSSQIFGAYFDIALKLVPYIKSLNSPSGDVLEMMYYLLEAVATASGNDKRTVLRLVQQFSPNDTVDISQYCDRLAQRGEIFAHWLRKVLLGLI